MPFTTSGFMTLPNAAASNNTAADKASNAGAFSMMGGGVMSGIAFAAFVALYLIWSLVQQHQKVRDQIQPKNIAVNFHNLWAIFLQVVVALGLFKLLLALLLKVGAPVKPVADAVEFAS